VDRAGWRRQAHGLISVCGVTCVGGSEPGRSEHGIELREGSVHENGARELSEILVVQPFAKGFCGLNRELDAALRERRRGGLPGQHRDLAERARRVVSAFGFRCIPEARDVGTARKHQRVERASVELGE
jgi:hypothetical protein